MLIFIILYFFFGFFQYPIDELIHERNPYLDGYLDVSWGKIDQPYFTYLHLIETLFPQIFLGLIFAIFGGFIGYILMQKENFLLKYSASFLGILFSLLLFLNNSSIISKGSYFGAGNFFDLFIASIGLLFIILFLTYFYPISVNKKKNGEPWKQTFFIPLILAVLIGFFILQGFGYAFFLPLTTTFFSCIIYVVFFIARTREKN